MRVFRILVPTSVIFCVLIYLNHINDSPEQKESSVILTEPPARHTTNKSVDVKVLIQDIVKKERRFVLQNSLDTFDPLTLEVPLPFLPNYRTPCFRNEDSKLYCLPYFFFLVSQKSGTTDLFSSLTSHPMICHYKRKESHWWNRGRFPLEIKIPTNLTFSQYMDGYSETRQEIEDGVNVTSNVKSGKYHPKVLGDFTASYLYDQLQWKRYPQNAGLMKPKVLSAHAIHHVLPNTKFIVILRDPSKRMFSDYCYYNRRGNPKPRDFHSKVKAGIAWFNNCMLKSNGSCIYDVPEHINTTIGWHPDLDWDAAVRLRASLYSEFLTDWFRVFDRKQFYIFRFEDYVKDQLHYVNEVLKFLGLETLTYLDDTVPQRQTRIKISFPDDTRRMLNEFYKPFNIKLSHMLGDDKYLWNDS